MFTTAGDRGQCVALVGDKKAPLFFIDEINITRNRLEQAGADRRHRLTSIPMSLPRPLLAVLGIVS